MKFKRDDIVKVKPDSTADGLDKRLHYRVVESRMVDGGEIVAVAVPQGGSAPFWATLFDLVKSSSGPEPSGLTCTCDLSKGGCVCGAIKPYVNPWERHEPAKS